MVDIPLLSTYKLVLTSKLLWVIHLFLLIQLLWLFQIVLNKTLACFRINFTKLNQMIVAIQLMPVNLILILIILVCFINLLVERGTFLHNQIFMVSFQRLFSVVFQVAAFPAKFIPFNNFILCILKFWDSFQRLLNPLIVSLSIMD